MALQARPEHLPDFRDPPLVEVVLGVQFASLTRFRVVHTGLLWQEYRQQFPQVTEQPPLEPVFETVGPQGSVDRGMRFEFTSATPIPRLWFVNEDQTQLIQFQPDRFIYNWRKVGSTLDADYPRYETIRSRFVEQYQKLKSFLSSQDLGDIAPNQCEVAYVNHIHSKEDEGSVSSLGKVIRLWRDPPPVSALSPVEDARFLFHVPLHTAEGGFLGRLTIVAEKAGRHDKFGLVRLTLTTRGIPLQPTDEGILQSFDLGRDRIVQAFTDITTVDMHERWGRLK